VSGSFEKKIPPGEDRERLVCKDCGFVAYENPKVVVGAVATAGDRILICKRALEPRTGYWTLPAGFLELNESAWDGAAREAWEEARARIEPVQLLATYSIPRISQVQLFYLARLVDEAVSAGPESLEVKLATWDEIPWNDLAFPSVRWALHHYRAVKEKAVFAPFSNPPGETGDMTR